MAGGLAGVLAAAAEVTATVHFALVAAVGLVTGLVATNFLVREPTRDGQPLFVRPRRPLTMLGVIA